MSPPFESWNTLDRVMHEPARLAILTALSACTSADFLHLQRLTGLSKGNLSGHLAKLEGAGLIWIDKRFVGKRPLTQLRLTEQGHVSLARHWQTLEHLRQSAEEWRPEA